MARLLPAAALVAFVAITLTSASRPATQQEPLLGPFTPISDYGKLCNASSDCQSGVCGYSCSSHDHNPMASTSCMCPCNDVDHDGPCCCGCLPAARYVPGGVGAVTTCPNAYAEDAPDGKQPQALATGNADTLYARLIEAGALEDEAVQWGDAANVTIETKYTGALYPGGKKFGQLCTTHAECELGICGTGCDCDSSIEKTCSCNAQAHFPAQVCGGCVRGKNATVGPCPVGVGIESTSMMVWVPESADAKVSPAYCTALELVARGVFADAVPKYIAACATGDNAAVGSAFRRANMSEPASVDALYAELVQLLCSWVPPEGGEKLNECRGQGA